MVPGTQKRKVDFTDLVFYAAIATKHFRMMVLLVTVCLAAGLVYYIYARPVFYSRAVIGYNEVKPPVDKTDVKEGRRFTEDAILDKITAAHVVNKVQERLGYVEQPGESLPAMVKKVYASFNTERNIELDFWSFNPDWVRTFPPMLVEVFEMDKRQRDIAEKKLVKERVEAELEKIEIEMQKHYYSQYMLETNYNPTLLKIKVEQLMNIPRDLQAVNQKLVEVDRVRQQLEQTPNLTVIEKLSLYYSVDVGLEAGMIIPSAPSTGPLSPENDGGADSDLVTRGGGNMVTSRFKTLGGGGRTGAGGGPAVVTRSLLRPNEAHWEALIKQRFQLEREYRDASKVYLPLHPNMVRIQKALDAIDRQLDEELVNAATRFDLSYNRLMDRRNQLQAQMPTFEATIKKLDQYENERRLKQVSDVDWVQIYGTAKRKLKELEVALEMEREDVYFIGFKGAIRDKSPVSPHKLKAVVYSLALGLALAIGIPLLIEFLDQTVTNMDKLEETTQMRGLGIVPDFEDTVAEAYPLIGSESMTDPDILENFRVIRTNLISSAATSKYPQVVMLSSTGPKEGKTVVASNLALSFAGMGDKTLIIDANLRRGLLHHLFSARSSPGLSNVLVEKLDVNEAIRPTSNENLFLLSTGDHLDGDIEMLGSNRMREIMDELRGKYQRIIIDAPPVLGLSETAILQPMVDGVVMVVWSAFTSTRSIRTAMDILADNHANIYGFVLNRLDLTATMNRFHYYYYSNHYYNRYQSVAKAG